jgi:hypothetical protein
MLIRESADGSAVEDWSACCAGHTLSWGGGDPQLLTPCYDEHGPTGAPGPLDPTRKHTYAVVSVLGVAERGTGKDGSSTELHLHRLVTGLSHVPILAVKCSTYASQDGRHRL